MVHILRRKPKYLFKDMFFHLKDFPGSSAGKESTCNAGDLGSVLGLGRSPGEGNGNPLQYSGLASFMGSQRVGHDWEPFFHLNVICPFGPRGSDGSEVAGPRVSQSLVLPTCFAHMSSDSPVLGYHLFPTGTLIQVRIRQAKNKIKWVVQIKIN